MTQQAYRNRLTVIAVSIAVFALTMACGTTKNIGTDGNNNAQDNTQGNENTLAFLRKVNDNAVYAKHLNAKADVTLNGKNLPVSVQMQTTQGKMIRLSLTALGLMEVGRIEMTPGYVLIIDRAHKKYARQSYDKVKFMAQNGLSFYTLEALIRNQLFLPGQNRVGEANIEQLQIDEKTSDTSMKNIRYSSANMTYNWKTDAAQGFIRQTTIEYQDKKKGNSTLQWTYDDFVKVGKKQYPSLHLLTVTLADKPGKPRTMQLQLSKINTTTDYSEPTTPSAKYEEVDIDELFQSLMNS